MIVPHFQCYTHSPRKRAPLPYAQNVEFQAGHLIYALPLALVFSALWGVDQGFKIHSSERRYIQYVMAGRGVQTLITIFYGYTQQVDMPNDNCFSIRPKARAVYRA